MMSCLTTFSMASIRSTEKSAFSRIVCRAGRGDLPQPGPGFADGQLDVEPLAVPVLFGPNGPHGGAGVAFDHGGPAFREKRLMISETISAKERV